MIEKSKVIKGLECCSGSDWRCPLECPYYGKGHEISCRKLLEKDALELLKEQEPVAPRKAKRYIEYSNTAVNFLDAYDCGNCGAELPDNSQYCSACGRKVKWDG